MKKNIDNTFFALVRLGIGKSGVVESSNVDWPALEALAAQQGLSAIVADGIDKLPQGQRPPKRMMLQLIGQVLNNYEYRFELYRRTVAEMAQFYNSHGMKMMVLKGYACSLTWPNPAHRHAGDIDIWQFGDYKKADALLGAEKGIKVDNSHHHHTLFYWSDFMVENHYDFINVHHHKSNARIEKIFKQLGKDDSHSIKVYGEKVYLPSPNLHALFLLKHSMSDFTSISISVRQLLDWAFHVERYGQEIDWNWLMGVLEEFRMKDYFNIINSICVEYLGFEFGCLTAHRIPLTGVDKELRERVIEDILHPKYELAEPSKLFYRLIYKYRRWRSNKWKHHFCYKESMWSAFWSGVWNHLLKPRSI